MAIHRDRGRHARVGALTLRLPFDRAPNVSVTGVLPAPIDRHLWTRDQHGEEGDAAQAGLFERLAVRQQQ